MRTAWVASLFLLCAMVAGCGPQPVTESEKMHPNGIGLDIETIQKPTGKPSR